MDRDQLLAFERIVHEGSFNRAAQSLGIAQATISGRIAALEQEVGGPLFRRGGRRAILTMRGDTLLPYARRVLSTLDAGIAAARQAETGAGGLVALGVVDSIADGVLLPAISRFRREHPATPLSIRTGHTPQIVQELLEGRVQLGLVSWQYTGDTRHLAVLTRWREQLLAVVAPTHPLAQRPLTTVEEIVATGNPYHETVWGTPEDARLVRDTDRGWREREFPHTLMRQLLLAGIGAGFLPAPLVRDDISSGRLVALPLPDASRLSRELALVRGADPEPLPQMTQVLVDLLCRTIAQQSALSRRPAQVTG